MELKIGNVRLENPYILAPMAGVTDLPFRLLCKEMGAGLICMEMVSAKAISFHNKNTEKLMEIEEKERPVSMQLFGSETDLIAKMAAQIEERPFDILDLNMGCPVPKVVNNGEGSALMKNPKLAGFKNISGFKELLQVPDPGEWAEKTKEEFEKLLLECQCRRISVNGINVEAIMADYFGQKLPFEAKKPEEFKDAIAVASIIQEMDNLSEEELYVVISNDTGFREAVKEKAKEPKNLIVYDSLNSFVEFLAMTDDLAANLKLFFDNGGAEKEIIEAVKEVVDNAEIEIERQEFVCIDDLEVVSIDDIQYEVSVLDVECGIATVSVNVNCIVKVWYDFTDENQSYWDKEEQGYLWQTVVELEDTYSLDFDMELSFDVSDWLPSVEDHQKVILKECVDFPTKIVLEEHCLIETEDVRE